eukprot:gene9908-10063_t
MAAQDVGRTQLLLAGGRAGFAGATDGWWISHQSGSSSNCEEAFHLGGEEAGEGEGEEEGEEEGADPGAAVAV